MGLDFYHHICNTCHAAPTGEPPAKFQSCSGCKLVSYCSRSHQKIDWKCHKKFCSKVQEILRKNKIGTLFSSLDRPTHETLYHYQTVIRLQLENQLERSLTFCELSMIYFPDICGLCLKPNDNSLVCCETCRLQFYCSEEHRLGHIEVHAKDCDSLILGFELFEFLSSNVAHPPSKVQQKTSVSFLDFPISTSDYFSNCVEPNSVSVFDKLIFSDILSYVLTLANVVRISDDLKNKNCLTIHFLGATQLECYMLNILDIFFFWLNHIEHLELVFVGPECPPADDLFVNNLLVEYSDKLTLSFHSDVLYHDLFSTNHKPPDILVAFNCGFHDATYSWQPTIDLILTFTRATLITTSYTHKEACDDAQLVIKDKQRISTLKLCEKNPFCSLNPHRNPELSESAVFFFNQYISIFCL